MNTQYGQSENAGNLEMAVKNPLLQKTLAFTASVVARFWRKTIDWRVAYFDPTVDRVHPHFSGRKIYICWHEYLLWPIMNYGHRSMLGLTSQHGDGELVSRAMQHLGWSIERGSTSRGGTGALIRLLKHDTRHISISPDGPRGPRRCMSTGPIFLASRLGLPLVCVGYGYDRAWRTRSWDRFAVPKPLAHGRCVVGPALHVPANLDRDGLELYRRWFEKLLTWLNEQAEAWAEGRRGMAGSMPMLVNRAPWAMHNPAHRSDLVLPEALSSEWNSLPGAGAVKEGRPMRKRAA
jgi:lysophospholipid acyltransferase (LPLAT)-like uncharacterized protein